MPSFSSHHYHHRRRHCEQQSILQLMLMLLLMLLCSLLTPRVFAFTSTTTQYATPLIVLNSDPVSYFGLYDLSLMYLLQAPDVHTTFGTGTVVTNSKAFFSNELDMASISAPLTPAQRSMRTSVTAFPFLAAAIAPIYRIDVLDSNVAPITFSRDLLVAIFTGRVRTWDDPMITALNPLLDLPNATINVILPVSGCDPETTLAFTSALQLFNASSMPFHPSINPAWPLSSYASYIRVNTTGQMSGLASAVVTTDLSISFATQAAALSVGAYVGNMINRAGVVVSPTSTAVNFALVELSTQSLQSSTASYDVMPLNDGSGSSVWPICVASFFLVDLEVSRDSCASREALVRLLLFIYQANTVKQMFEDRGYSTMPDVVMNALNIVSRLTNDVMCHGIPALPPSVSSRILLYGAPRMHFMMNLQATAYGVANTNISFTYSDSESNVVFAQLLSGEIDIGTLYPEEVDQSKLELVRQSGEFTMMPLFLDTIIVHFSLRITDTVDLTDVAFQPITLDMPLLTLIFARRIRSWLDPAILALNPDLARLLANVTSAPITLVRMCSAGKSPYHYLAQPLRNYARRFNQSLLSLVDEYEATPALHGVTGCMRQRLIDGVAWTHNLASIEPLIDSIPGAIGVFQDNQPEGELYHRAQTRLLYPRRDPATGALKTYSTYSRPASSRACFDAFDYTRLELIPEDSISPECYPLQDFVYMFGRKVFASSATNAASCERGKTAVEMMLWMMVTDGLTVASDAQNWVRFASMPLVKAAYVEALNQSLCDVEPLLYLRPVVWELNPAISSFGRVGSGLGIAYCVLAFVIITVHHKHAVIRSASPVFLAMSMLGVLFLLISSMLWVTEPSLGVCSSFAWMLNLGIYLTFAPLFAKTWRIYRIFGHKKLKVVKITNGALALSVSLGLAVEMIVLIAWQSTSPMQPILTVEWVGAPPREHDYTQCGVASSGNSFFTYMIVSKVVMLAFGVVMAFTTRKVKSTFNESQGIAYSIYNICFSAGLIIPITLLVDAKGDVFTLLLLFLMLWVSLFTVFILTASKFALVLKLVKPEEDLAAMSVTGGSRFSFMSFASISSRATMQAYLRALDEHVAAARKHLMSLPSDGASTARSVAPSQRRGGGGEERSKIEVVDNHASTLGGNTNASMISFVRERPMTSRANTIYQLRDAKPVGGGPAAKTLTRQQSFQSKADSSGGRSGDDLLSPGSDSQKRRTSRADVSSADDTGAGGTTATVTTASVASAHHTTRQIAGGSSLAGSMVAVGAGAGAGSSGSSGMGGLSSALPGGAASIGAAGLSVQASGNALPSTSAVVTPASAVVTPSLAPTAWSGHTSHVSRGQGHDGAGSGGTSHARSSSSTAVDAALTLPSSVSATSVAANVPLLNTHLAVFTPSSRP